MTRSKLVAVLIIALFVTAYGLGCESTKSKTKSNPTKPQTSKPKTATGPANTVTTRPATIAPAPAPAPAPPPTTSNFHGYDCTDDCSGHEAGYEWAEEHGITDPGDCGGNSDSFIEGCEAYAEEQMEEYEEDYYDDGYYEDEYYED